MVESGGFGRSHPNLGIAGLVGLPELRLTWAVSEVLQRYTGNLCWVIHGPQGHWQRKLIKCVGICENSD